MSRILGFVMGALLVFGGLYYLLTPAGMAPVSVELELPIREVDMAVQEPQPEPEPEPAPEPAESAEIEVPQPESPRPAPPSEPARVQFADQTPPAAPGQSPSAVDIADEQTLVEQALAAMQAQQPMQRAQPEPAPSAFPDAAPDESTPAPGEDTQWFAVWDPFHSELSANAFARRLERMTGLDYRVVRSGPAKYEVAVAFRSEAERVANIALIEEATGLRIAGGTL